MNSTINGCRKFCVDEKTGIADEVISFYPESYLKNANSGYYKSLNPKEIICEFILKEKLGEGAFGSVRLGINKQTGEKVAIKILEKSKLSKYENKIKLDREIEILKKLKHPNIIQLYSVIETERQFLLIMEYIRGKELYQYILVKKKISEEEACLYFQQIISGIEYLHKLKIAHRDIKAENILIEQNTKTIKIVDFGLSNTYDDKEEGMLSTACGSPCYAAPEMLEGKLYKGGKVDIWSAGVVLFAMICGYLPFEDEDNSELYKKIINGKYSIPSHVSKQGRDLIYGLLNTNPRKRINISQIKKHSWIKLYSSGLYNNGDTIFNTGLYLDKYVIPIDEEIIEEMKEKFQIPKMQSRIAILSNKLNDYTTLYYLMLNQKIMNGQKSISDLKSDLFLNYLKDRNNLLSNYKNLQDAINSRKMGVDFELENLENNFPKGRKNVKSQENIHDLKSRKTCTPKYISSSDIKINANTHNGLKIKSPKSNYNRRANSNKANITTTNTPSNSNNIKKFNIISTDKEKEVNNALDVLECKVSKHKNNLSINTINSNKSQNESELNYDKRYNKINQSINSTTMTPSFQKNKKSVLNKKNKLKKNNMFEISIENKNNKTQIINQNNNNINLSKDKYKKENRLSTRQRNVNKSPLNSDETIKEEKETKTIEEFKQDKLEDKEKEKDIQKENDNNTNIEINIGNYDGNDIYENIKKENVNDKDNKSEKIIDEYLNIGNDRINNKSYDNEERRNTKNINHKEYIKITRKKDIIDNGSEQIINGDLQSKIKINSEISDFNYIDEKFKLAPTLDSFSLPTINQEKNILSFNMNNKEISYPQCELNNKSTFNKKDPAIKINRFKKKQNLTNKLIKTRSKLRLNIKKDKDKEKEKNISNYSDNKLIRQIKNEIKNRNSKQKYYKKIEGNNFKKKYLESNSSGNNLYNSELKEINRSRVKKNSIKHNNDYSRTENTVVLTNNMCSINQKDKNTELFDREKNKSNKSKEKDIKMNNDTKSENKEIKNKNKKNCHHIKYNSIDNEREFYRYNRYSTSDFAGTPSNNGENNLIRINTVNIIKKKRSKNKINKFTLEEKVTRPDGNYGKINKNKNEGRRSGYILNRNSKNDNKNKIISDILSPMNYTSKQRNTFSIDRIDIRNKNMASPRYNGISAHYINNLHNYFTNKEKNIINNEQSYEPIDLSCIFSLPRKVIKEKILKSMESIKCRVKQINLYKYNVIYGDKRNIYEFNLPLSNLGVVKVKKIKGNYKDYVNDIRKIICNKLI